MKLLLFLFLALPALAVEDDLAKLTRLVKARKEELKNFRTTVSQGKKCPVRDYDCFSREVLSFVQGYTEDLVEAQSVLEPFYERSTAEGNPPCEVTCENTLLASHLKLFLEYLDSNLSKAAETERTPAYPSISSVRARAYLDLTAYHSLVKSKERLSLLYSRLDFGKVTKPELTNKKWFETALKKLDPKESFKNSVLCQLAPDDPVYETLMKGNAVTGKQIDRNFITWMKHFDENTRPGCTNKAPLVYRGSDKATRAYYRQIRDQKLRSMDCASGDFACVRRVLRDLKIHYAEDLDVVGKRLISFMQDSRLGPCDDTCMAQSLVRMIQTFITFLSTLERENLGSTMDWTAFPLAKATTVKEDLALYESLRRFTLPIFKTFKKIDPKNIQDPGLRSELRSVYQDLSEFSTAAILSDSYICEMKAGEETRFPEVKKRLGEFRANVCRGTP